MPRQANNPFLSENKYGRFFGGSKGENPIDAYVTGYHYIFFEIGSELQKAIYGQIVENSVDGSEKSFDSNIAGILNIHNTNFTPAAISLNKTTVPGMGGRKYHQPTSMELGDNVSVNYNEYSGLPIYKIHKYWVNSIRNKDFGGIGSLDGKEGSPSFTYKDDYSANIYYATVRPDGKTIETAQLYTGAFPTKIPSDSFASDIASIEKVDVSIDYSYDYLYDNEKVIIDKLKVLIGNSLASGLTANQSRIKN